MKSPRLTEPPRLRDLNGNYVMEKEQRASLMPSIPIVSIPVTMAIPVTVSVSIPIPPVAIPVTIATAVPPTGGVPEGGGASQFSLISRFSDYLESMGK